MAKKPTTHYWTSAKPHRGNMVTTAWEKRMAKLAAKQLDSIEAKLKMIKEEAGMPVYASLEDRLKI